MVIFSRAVHVFGEHSLVIIPVPYLYIFMNRTDFTQCLTLIFCLRREFTQLQRLILKGTWKRTRVEGMQGVLS